MPFNLAMLQAYIAAAQLIIAAGANIGSTIAGIIKMIRGNHPELTPDQIVQICTDLLTDDAMRSAFAALASGQMAAAAAHAMPAQKSPSI